MFEIKPCEIVVIRKSGRPNPRCGTYSSDVYSSVPLAQGMPVPKLGHDRNGVKTGVLSEGRRDNLKCIRVSLETVRFHTLQRMSVVRQQPRNVDLR